MFYHYLVAAFLGGLLLFVSLLLLASGWILLIALLPLLVYVLLPHVSIDSLRSPAIPVLLFTALSFFRLHEAYPPLKPLHLIFVAGVVTLLYAIWQIFLTRRIKPYWSRELTLLALFFGLITLGLVMPFDRDTSTTYWQQVYIKIVLMVPLIAWFLRSETDYNWLSRIVVVSGILLALRVAYNKFHGLSLVEGTRVTIGRLTNATDDDPNSPYSHMVSMQDASILSDPNDLALILMFPLGFAAGLLLFRSSRLNTLLGIVGVVLIIAAITFTQSRGALLGILAMLGVVGLRLIRSKILLGAIGLAAFAALFFAMGIANRSSGGIADMQNNRGIDQSAEHRLLAWQAGFNMAVDNPLFGVGIANFPNAFYEYTPVWINKAMAPHSTWFEVLGQSGFLGLAVFLTMLGTVIVSALRSDYVIRHSNAPPLMKGVSLAVVASLAAFCIAGSFLTQGFTWPIYILLALTVSLRHYATGLGAVSGKDFSLVVLACLTLLCVIGSFLIQGPVWSAGILLALAVSLHRYTAGLSGLTRNRVPRNGMRTND